MHHAASCLTDNQPRCQLLLAGYLATCGSTRSAGHRRPVPAPLPDRRAGGTAGSAGRSQGPAAHSARAARPALSHGGILAAEALSDLFSGGGLFGGDRDSDLRKSVLITVKSGVASRAGR